jgi:hypothetical protein
MPARLFREAVPIRPVRTVVAALADLNALIAAEAGGCRAAYVPPGGSTVDGWLG